MESMTFMKDHCVIFSDVSSTNRCGAGDPWGAGFGLGGQTAHGNKSEECIHQEKAQLEVEPAWGVQVKKRLVSCN